MATNNKSSFRTRYRWPPRATYTSSAEAGQIRVLIVGGLLAASTINILICSSTKTDVR